MIVIRRTGGAETSLPYGNDAALARVHLGKLLAALRQGWSNVRLVDRDGSEICTVLMDGVEAVHAGVDAAPNAEIDFKSAAAGQRTTGD